MNFELKRRPQPLLEGGKYFLQGKSSWVKVNGFSVFIQDIGGEGVRVQIFEHLKEMEEPIDQAWAAP